MAAAKGIDCRSYVGLRLNTHLKVNASVTVVKPPTNVQPSRRIFAVREGKRADEPIKKLGMSDEDCERPLWLGMFRRLLPFPPKPASPAGTPVVSSLVKRIHQLELCLDAIGLDGGMD